MNVEKVECMTTKEYLDRLMSCTVPILEIEMRAHIEEKIGYNSKRLNAALSDAKSYLDIYYAKHQIVDEDPFFIPEQNIYYYYVGSSKSAADMLDIIERYDDRSLYSSIDDIRHLKHIMDSHILYNIENFMELLSLEIKKLELTTPNPYKIQYTVEELQQICINLRKKGFLHIDTEPVIFANILLNGEKGQIKLFPKISKSQVFYIAFKLLFRDKDLKNSAEAAGFANQYFKQGRKSLKIERNNKPENEYGDIEGCFKLSK